MKQPKPKRNNTNPDTWDEVIKDMNARNEFGKNKYGVALKPFNGRDSLLDIYEELLDAVVYIKNLIIERGK